MKSVKIIGFGVVGKNMYKIFNDAKIHDPKQMETFSGKTEIAFICVPTDMKYDGSADTSIVEKAIKENDAEIFIIKSTVPPGTTEAMAKETGKTIIFSPEYFGGTIHANHDDYGFTILGGDKKTCNRAVEKIQSYYHPSHKFIFTDSKTAELCKYMENSWLATKVTFCNEFYRIAKKIDVDYTELRELFLQDPRVTRSHTFVYPEQPYFDSHCLNKDIPALLSFCESIGYNPKLLKRVFSSNLSFKGEHNGNI